MEAKFEEFTSATKVCEWLDEHPDAHIIGMTQYRWGFTIFYREITNEDYTRASIADIDPHFGVPAPDFMRHVRTAPSVHENAGARPTVVC